MIERANSSEYGLAGAVHTPDIEKALYVSNSLRAGSVWYEFCGIKSNISFSFYPQSSNTQKSCRWNIKISVSFENRSKTNIQIVKCNKFGFML